MTIDLKKKRTALKHKIVETRRSSKSKGKEMQLRIDNLFTNDKIDEF